jgi:excisionase family DNA binding protein
MKRQTLVAVMAILETDPSITDEQSDLVADVLYGRLDKKGLEPPVSPIPIRPPVEAKPKPETKEYMNNQEAIEYTGLSLRSLEAYRSKGELPYHKVGAKVVFKSADLDGFMARFRVDVSR